MKPLKRSAALANPTHQPATFSIELASRKRVNRACDRCVVKKVRCDGSTPCSRCLVDDTVCCSAKPRKEDDGEPVSAARAKQLQAQRDLLARALRVMWRENARDENRSKIRPGREPSIHAIVQSTGVLSEMTDLASDELFNEVSGPSNEANGANHAKHDPRVRFVEAHDRSRWPSEQFELDSTTPRSGSIPAFRYPSTELLDPGMPRQNFAPNVPAAFDETSANIAFGRPFDGGSYGHAPSNIIQGPDLGSYQYMDARDPSFTQNLDSMYLLDV